MAIYVSKKKVLLNSDMYLSDLKEAKSILFKIQERIGQDSFLYSDIIKPDKVSIVPRTIHGVIFSCRIITEKIIVAMGV